ncbi:unnamed protein product [Meloidogyne enterolobii]|uniref:Uncharacterized protein n=1 Tax=Meloidogyne enterolobii TaxID=390850 RepID=A0ACB0ZBT0_MELEN
MLTTPLVPTITALSNTTLPLPPTTTTTPLPTTTTTTTIPPTTSTTTIRSLPTTISFIVITNTTLVSTAVPCGTWNSWMKWSDCNDSCGSCGTRQRFRSCLTAQTCNCTGTAFEKEVCNTQVCLYPRTSCCPTFSPASVNNTFTCVPSDNLSTQRPNTRKRR